MNSTSLVPEAPTKAADPESLLSGPSLVPLPSAGSLAPLRQSSTLTPVVCDPRAIARLLELLLQKGGLTTRAAAKLLGTSDQSLRQYLKGRRGKPSLLWFVKLCEACGARLVVELPPGDRRF